MERLFYEDQYIKEFTAELMNVVEKDGKFHVVLDKTAFFPGGGGQACDKGLIEGEEVVDVYEEHGIIYHVLNRKPIKLHKLKCSIDWKHRRDGMDQHLAQHVLSGCFFKLFNHNTAGIHIGKDVSTVDIVGILDEETIRKAEVAANEVIGDNIKVDFLWPDKKQLTKMGLRRALPKTNEPIRVVKIGDLDINACCGVHPSSTIELRMIKIRRWEKHKGNTRIEYLAGDRAIEEAYKKDRILGEITKYLNGSEEEAVNGIRNLNEKFKEAVEKNHKYAEEISAYEMKDMLSMGETIKDITVIKKIYEDQDLKYVSKIAKKLSEESKVIALLAVKNNDRVNMIFSASEDVKIITMNELLKDAITLIDGKGGGSRNLAQGAGKNNSNLDSALDYAVSKIKQLN